MRDVLLPQLGEGIEKATVALWHIGSGDKVSAEDDIVEVVTDKATFHVPAGFSGKIGEILVPEGAEVAVGQPLARIVPARAE